MKSSILSTVHAVETPLPTDSETICASPLCDVRFEQSGLAVSPRRFCCDQCKQNASIIRRASKLLQGLSDSELIEIVRSEQASVMQPSCAFVCSLWHRTLCRDSSDETR